MTVTRKPRPGARRGRGSGSEAERAAPSGTARRPAAVPGLAPSLRPPAALQRKPKVAPSDDPLEREADVVAEQVVQGRPAAPISGVAGGTFQRKPEQSDESEEELQAKSIQREGDEDEEQPQAKPIQRAADEDEEPLQARPIQREADDEDEALQAKPVQRDADEDEQEAAEAGEVESAREAPAEEGAESASAVVAEETENAAAEEAGVGADVLGHELPEEEAVFQAKRARDDETGAAAPGGDSARESRAVDTALQRRGSGAALGPELRSRAETTTGADLSRVRVHDDSAAHAAAEAINARAFTHGRDIWLGRGESRNDTRLMAHELTHVVQQSTRPGAPPVQRAAGDPPRKFEMGGAEIDLDDEKILFPSIKVPTTKLSRMPETTDLEWETGERDTDQMKEWEDAVKDSVNSHVESKLENAPEIRVRDKPTYYLRAGSDHYLVGTSGKIKQRSRRPTWSKSRAGHDYDVDHIQEIQLSGEDEIENMWLWDSSANRSSGSKIKSQIHKKVTKLLDQSRTDVEKGLGDQTPSFETVESEYDVIFKRAKGGLSVAGSSRTFWTVDEIKDGKHIDKLTLMRENEISEKFGDPTELSIFTSSSGGERFVIKPWEQGQTSASGEFPFYDSFKGTEVTYQDGSGTVTGKVMENNEWFDEQTITLEIKPQEGVEYGGYIDGRSLKSQLGDLGFKPLSPVVISEADLVPGIGVMARGKLNPSIPLISKAEIDVEITGNDVSLVKTLSAPDFEFPKPLTVTEAGVVLRAGTGGLSATGKAAFELEGVGEGELEAKASTAGGFSAEGAFRFDSELFDPAEIKVWYRDEKIGGEGHLGIPDGQVKGVKSASLDVTVDGERWAAEGTVEPNVPGVKEGSLEVEFDPDGGLKISGRLEFSGDVPRVKGGYLEAAVEKSDSGYAVSGTGSAELDIPGVDAAVSVEYDDGIFTAEARVGYERGIASGFITAGVTNRPVGDDGRPAGEPGDDLTVYGSGSVTLKFTPWLEGTAGIKLDPTGKMTVTGRVAIPDTIEVFPEKKIEKELLSVGVDLPIVGVAVAGQRIGIFLNISGNVRARAAIGPGELREAQVEVEYDPEDESSAKITGSARFVIPADAGLRLAISGSIGAGIPVVSAQAGLEIGGELGVEGEAAAAAELEWTPQAGINLEAEVSLIAQPKFTFDVTGFVEVTADLLLTEIDLYSKRWQLASVEFGSNMQVGAKLPVRVVNGEFQDLSINDVEFITPDVDPIDVAKGLIEQIA